MLEAPSSTSPAGPWSILLTCEHGGNTVPPEFASLFATKEAAADLNSHRGHDPGALGLALTLAERLGAPLLLQRTTRLLADQNRSPHALDVYSRWSGRLNDAERARLLARFHTPHRAATEDLAHRLRPTLHLSVHSFVDQLDGRVRDLDVGVLFDPDRSAEAGFAQSLLTHLCRETSLRSRANEPYLGTDDGLTTTLRGRLLAAHYAGLELELRQGLLAVDGLKVAEQLALAIQAAAGHRGGRTAPPG